MKSKKVLVIGFVWPEPTSSAAGWRMLQLLDFFIENQYEVHFASAAHKSDFAFVFDATQVTEHEILLNDASFDAFVSELQPDVVVYDRFMIEEQFGWRVRENCKQALQILDTEDLHFVRKAREQAFKKQQDVNYHTNEMIREVASILRCDLSLIISEVEMEMLLKQFHIPAQILMYLPFMQETLSETDLEQLPNFEARTHFMFIGNFMHEPNWQTVLRLKRDIWPVLRKKLPKAEMHIFGAYPNPKALQLHKPAENFFVNGRAKDVNIEMQKHKVLLAPIPFGAGIKGKFIDAMRNRLPSVTTQLGSESMQENTLWNGFICDSDADFIEKAVLLYTEESAWKDATQNGLSILNATSNKKQYAELFKNRLTDLEIHLETYRKANLFGKILRYQTNQATKYMGLWIQEKHKKF